MSKRISVLQIKSFNIKTFVSYIKAISQEFKSNVYLKVQQNGKSYKCLPIPKIIFEWESIQEAHAKDLMKTVTVHNQINYERIKDTIANQSMLSLDFSIEQKYWEIITSWTTHSKARRNV